MKIELYILTGQSNAGGNGQLEELAGFARVGGASLNTPQSEVLFSLSYHDGSSQNNPDDPLFSHPFGPLVPGDTELNGKHPGFFGPEVSFLDRMAALRKAPVALMKYYVNGASLGGHFNAKPGVGSGGAFRGLISSIVAAEKWMTDQGHDFAWKGLLWFQGETDAGVEKFAKAYHVNLQALIAGVRNRVRSPALPVVIFQTQNLTGEATPIVQKAQSDVAEGDCYARLVDTSPQIPNMRDHVHYHAAAHVAFGHEGAEAMHALQPVG